MASGPKLPVATAESELHATSDAGWMAKIDYS